MNVEERILQGTSADEPGTTPQAVSQVQGPSLGDTERARPRTRRSREHVWPEVGAVLEADYHGRHYEAEVTQARLYKSGKALKVLTGPAAGRVFHSMSGAMLAATEAQRAEQGLGRKGVSSGWDFWKGRGAR